MWTVQFTIIVPTLCICHVQSLKLNNVDRLYKLHCIIQDEHINHCTNHQKITNGYYDLCWSYVICLLGVGNNISNDGRHDV